MESAKRSISGFAKSHFFKHGLPFFIILFGGVLTLKQFASLRYEFSRNENISSEERENLKKIFLDPSQYNIETEYKKLKVEVDIDNWENKRIPRPWEENK